MGVGEWVESLITPFSDASNDKTIFLEALHTTHMAVALRVTVTPFRVECRGVYPKMKPIKNVQVVTYSSYLRNSSS